MHFSPKVALRASKKQEGEKCSCVPKAKARTGLVKKQNRDKSNRTYGKKDDTYTCALGIDILKGLFL